MCIDDWYNELHKLCLGSTRRYHLNSSGTLRNRRFCELCLIPGTPKSSVCSFVRYCNPRSLETMPIWAKSWKSFKLTNMAWLGLRIRLFESHSHFLSIGKPPRSPNTTKIYQNEPVLDLRTVTPNGEIPLPGQMGSRHMFPKVCKRLWAMSELHTVDGII